MTVNVELSGMGLMVLGGALVVVGIWGWVTSGDDPRDAGIENDAAIAVPSPASTTIPAPADTATVQADNTTTTRATTTTAATTTTILDAVGEIETFVPEFAAAIEREDIDFLFATLHPVVIDLYGESECRRLIEDEILLLREYRLIGEVEGPRSRGPIAGTTLDLYDGPVAFTFQGEEFESQAAFAFEDGEVRWFTECE